jgi:hypothetical protein
MGDQLVNWYRLVRFKCPTCGQRLVVFGAQVQRGEIVTCQNCNTDMLLNQKGRPEPVRPADQAAAHRVELSA